VRIGVAAGVERMEKLMKSLEELQQEKSNIIQQDQQLEKVNCLP
jgi:hypothetical protein